MTVEVNQNQRKQQIIQIIEKQAFCSKDKIFTKGKISKSKLTERIISNLISSDKIRILHTENGKPRYYVATRKADLLTVKYLFKELEYRWRQTTRSLPQSRSLVEKYAILFRNRIKILEHENKRLVELNLEDTIEIIQKIQSFLDEPSDTVKHIRYIDWQIKRDKYYLNHELHSNPRNFHYPFQKRKFRHERRTLADLLDMKKKGRHEYSLRTVDFNKNINKLDSDSDFEYEELFNRLFAEHNRTLYRNPEMTPNQIMLKVTNDRLSEINRKHSLSKNYEYEKKVLEDWRDIISKIPIEELLKSPKYEGGFVPRSLLSRYSKKEPKKRVKYS